MKPFYTEAELEEIRRADEEMEARGKKRGRPPGARNKKSLMMTPEEKEKQYQERKARRNAYARAYYQKNREAMKAYSRQYYREHAGAMREYHREYDRSRPADKRERARRYYYRHREEILEKRRKHRYEQMDEYAEKARIERKQRQKNAERIKKRRRIEYLETRIAELNEEKNALVKWMEENK